MFHWICPECGREIPPAVLQCPTCDPQPEQNAQPSLKPSAIAEPPVATAAAPPPAPVLRESRPQPTAQPSPKPSAIAEPPVVPAAAPPPAPVLRESRPQPTAQPSPKPSAIAEPPVATAAAPPPSPVLSENRPQPDPAADVLLALAQHIRAAQTAQPAPIATAGLPDLAAAVRAEQLPTPDLIPVAAPVPVEASAKFELAPLPATQVAQPVALLAPPAPPVAEPAPPALAEPLPAALPKPVAPGEAAKNTTAPLIQPPPPPIRETADKPPSGSWLRLAPLLDYTDTATRGMHPVVPLPKIAMPDCGPRITLPGPLLPPELQQRKNLRVLTAVGQQKKRITLPAWMVSVAAMLALLIAGIFAVTYLLPASHSAANAKTAAAPVETPANPPEASHTLAEYVEVTGFRFVMDPNKKSEIHYLVVNHSASELSDMTVYVTVKSASAKPGQPPVCRFSFRSSGLGPFESREMVSSIEKLSRPITLPDWHDLKAEVQISE